MGGRRDWANRRPSAFFPVLAHKYRSAPRGRFAPKKTLGLGPPLCCGLAGCRSPRPAHDGHAIAGNGPRE